MFIDRCVFEPDRNFSDSVIASQDWEVLGNPTYVTATWSSRINSGGLFYIYPAL